MKTALIPCLALAGSSLAETQPYLRPAPEPFEIKADAEAAADSQNTGFDDFDANAPRLIQVTLEWIEVPQAEATRLLYQQHFGKQGDPLRAELQKLIDRNTASVFETTLLTCRSGEKATTESIREVIYPTEFQAQTAANTPADKDGTGNPAQSTPQAAVSTPVNPAAFETRNTGSTLEIEPTLGTDNRIIDLLLRPEIVFHTGGSIHQRRKDTLGNEITIETPLFYSLRTKTAVTLIAGQHQLLTVLSPKGANGELDSSRKLFVIVRADSIAVVDQPAAK